MLALFSMQGFAQSLEYKVKAEFLERFTRFIEWPADSQVADPGQPFRLCVIGTNPFGSYIFEMADEVRIKGKPVTVQELSRPDQCGTCDLVFISGTASEDLAAILKVTDGRPILTIGDTPGFTTEGVLINLSEQETRIVFDVNSTAVKRSRLRFSSRLMALASHVKELRGD